MAKYSGQLVAVPTFDTADALKVLKYQKYIVDVYNMHHHQHGTHLVTRKAAENEFKKLLQSNYFADKPFRKLEHLDNLRCVLADDIWAGLEADKDPYSDATKAFHAKLEAEPEPVIEARFQGGNEEWREKIASVEKFEELCEQLNLDVVFFKTAGEFYLDQRTGVKLWISFLATQCEPLDGHDATMTPLKADVKLMERVLGGTDQERNPKRQKCRKQEPYECHGDHSYDGDDEEE